MTTERKRERGEGARARRIDIQVEQVICMQKLAFYSKLENQTLKLRNTGIDCFIIAAVNMVHSVEPLRTAILEAAALREGDIWGMRQRN